MTCHRRELARVGRRTSAIDVGLVIVADPLMFAAWFCAGLAADAWVAPLDPTAPQAASRHANEPACST